MAKTYDQLNDKLIAFIRKQHVFFVATAPLSDAGSVNVSPKGYDSFAVLDPRTVAYLDYGGSGVETISHLRENGRITLMFCAFEGAANIVRLYGKGRAIQSNQPGFAEAAAPFSDSAKARAVIVVDVHRVSDSCGWAVPFMDFREERQQYRRYMDNIPEQALADGWAKSNPASIDGLPGYLPSRADAAE